MVAVVPVWMRRAFSVPRLGPYLRATNGDGAAAILLYWWNVEVSGAFYGPLHCLEVSLRNALHDELRAKYHSAHWWTRAPLNANGLKMVADARAKCVRRSSGHASADDIVAELSFGFWVSLVSTGTAYDRKLWVPTLHRAFPHYPGRRDRLHESLLSMVLLRNRIMHHEPIHHRDLGADHAKLHRLLGYLSPELAKEAQALDRVPAVLRRRSEVCGGVASPRF